MYFTNFKPLELVRTKLKYQLDKFGYDNRPEVWQTESTKKTKWNQIPLASSLPYYFPKYMFNRNYFWINQGSVYTTKYKSNKWEKSGKFKPYNSYYPDLERLSLN